MPTLKLKSALLTSFLLALAACTPLQTKPPVVAGEKIQDEAKKPPLPNQELTAQSLYQYLVGEVALQRGQPELAAEALLDLAKRTRDPRLAQRATETAIQGRQTVQAGNAATLWQSLDPESPQATQAAAALLVNSGRLNEARPYLEKLIAAEGESRAAAFLHLNQMLARQPDREAVLALVQDLAKPYLGSAEAHFAIAQAAWSASKRQEAITELRLADSLRPGWELAALFQGQALQKVSVSDSMEFYRAFLRDYPKASEVRLAYARLLVSEKSYPQARAEFQRVLDISPNNAELSFAVGLLALQASDLDAAESYLKQALSSGYKDEDLVHFYLGQIAEERKQFKQAAEWFVRVGPGEHYLNAQTRYAGVLAKQDRLGEARQHLQQIQPQNIAQRVLLIQAEAQLLREAKQHQEAFGVLEKGLEKLPNQPELLYDHAMAAEKLDLLDVMEKDLRQLIQIKPDNAHAYNALGYTFAERGIRLEEALQLTEKALSLASDDPLIMDSLGWAYYRHGEHGKAAEWLKKAHELRQDPEIAAHLGEVLWAQGQRDEARKVWNSALKLAPDNEVLRNVMQKFK
ncbi:MAG: tetratricopeptide repeat protein [Gammaproteobacteria bacterium]|nr:tetratricopeptide repeat protein [Gammaproteobacteria bacterium]MBU1732033.1 tetratricopeptide repeat protein [Gammaproteobacteria bacterium]MBU1894074.1 tetratricopeptide repeat protein [Gammaproteobacteria bacterium]